MSKNILVIAAHPDDEVLGCGGTIASRSYEGDQVNIVFVADGVGARLADFECNLKERKKSAYKAASILGVKSVEFFDFPDNQLDTIPLLSIVQKLEQIIEKFKPEIIYTHHYGDLNIDHQITHRATMTACRPSPHSSIKQIYAYEVLSSTEWALNGNVLKPQYFVNIAEFINQKIDALSAYEKEVRLFPHPRSFEAVRHLAALRGAHMGQQFCEAFQLIRYIHD